MENNFSANSNIRTVGVAGYTSPILLAVAVLGLCFAMFLIALPGVAAQLQAPENEPARSTEMTAIPLQMSMSTADRQLQIAESFNAALDRSSAQSAPRADAIVASR